MKPSDNKFDVIVVGGGHAGAEAALASARLGVKTALVSQDKYAIARMSCNPAIGGLAKGQIVREIDVLGGIVGLAADAAGLQFKLLNRSKGRSVWSPRAQTDKRVYESYVLHLVETSENLTLLRGEVVDIIDKNYSVSGVILRNGERLASNTVVITCGTFLNGLIHIGNRKILAGRMGESNSVGITESLTRRGIKSGRLKTGTPPRLFKESVNWEKLDTVAGDENPVPFSYRTKNFNPPNIPCHIAKTNSLCHEIIYNDIERAPLFSGDIFSKGPRYCPSIEDKIFRFAHHESHTLFLEPEWRDSDQIYVNGFASSLPEDVQLNALRQVSGLEKAEFLRPGYAIEYDFFPPAQLKATLESKFINGLYFAGQINGTSGYEEASGQGLVAGINAAKLFLRQKPLTLRRDEAYIGVLIDDLITKDTMEPYRMFTSRAEHRLLLRYSNADQRLAEKAKQYGLISDKFYDFLFNKLQATERLVENLNKCVSPNEINGTLSDINGTTIKHSQPARQILKRPGIKLAHLPKRFTENNDHSNFDKHIIDEIHTEAETIIKYAGYIVRQYEQIERLKSQDKLSIPRDFNYLSINSLSNEAREKLDFVKPETLGQAIRVSGVTPADVGVLSVMLYKSK
ncbi:tRNA uridine-5-carboxymethylaminomethyl(34) synthesis enzyme MnmG [bacterium]|nr:tRNA uridine-5-carboxymethylaminomethyl(34) synthesis enzyme MnmG [bacterium]